MLGPLTHTHTHTHTQLVGVVWVVIPVREIVQVECLNQPVTLPNSILISVHGNKNTIIFASLDDRDRLIATISGFVSQVVPVKKM